jgi:hypothetical protein
MRYYILPNLSRSWVVVRIHCLNLDLGGFVDFRMVARIHCLNLDLGGFLDLWMVDLLCQNIFCFKFAQMHYLCFN